MKNLVIFGLFVMAMIMVQFVHAQTVDEVVEMIEFAIEQHPSLLKVIPAEELDEKAKLDNERMWKY